jgi:hypothetical protein
MPAHHVVLRHPHGREELRVVSVPGELDVGYSFTLEGAEWIVVSKESGESHGVRSLSVFVCERRST